MDCRFRLVAGLGNPGREYDQTRHNVGFLVVEALARRAGVNFIHEPKWNADIARADKVTFMKPMTFMNLSGESVGDFCHYFKFQPEQTLIIIDDATLPLGYLRLRSQGSAGGHNGLESVLMHLGSERVPRLRLGINGAKDSLADHVLGKFSSTEQSLINKTINRAIDAVEYAQANGLEMAMNHFNFNEQPS